MIQTTKTNDLINLQSRRYIGNKTKLLNWIAAIVEKETKGCTSFLDLFAGTGVVAKHFLDKYDTIIINDILFANHIIYKALFANDNFDKNKMLAFITKYNNIDAEKIADNYFSINYGDKFFTAQNAKIIGWVREDIEANKKNLTAKEYNLLLTILIYAADKIANTVGHFEAFIKKEIKIQKINFKWVEILETQKVQIFQQDANELVKSVSADIVYIDPPYNSRQYSRFYHVYETLIKWQKPVLTGVAMKPPVENMSVYCTVKAKNAFSDLIKDIKAKYIIVSYNNTFKAKSSSSENKIQYDEIMTILEQKGKVSVFECEHSFFNAGKSDLENHKEYIFVCKVFSN